MHDLQWLVDVGFDTERPVRGFVVSFAPGESKTFTTEHRYAVYQPFTDVPDGFANLTRLSVDTQPLTRFAGAGTVTFDIEAPKNVLWLTVDHARAPAGFHWTEVDGVRMRTARFTLARPASMAVEWQAWPAGNLIAIPGLPACAVGGGPMSSVGDLPAADRRVCRNLPYALYGRPFRADDLTRLFYEDGPLVMDRDGYQDAYWSPDDWSFYLEAYAD